jgi:hypothetical protein
VISSPLATATPAHRTALRQTAAPELTRSLPAALASSPALAADRAGTGLIAAAAPAPALTIGPAVSASQREAASDLIAQRYAWRGYQAATLPPAADRRRITLIASVADCVLGTITVGLDGPAGLNCEQAFADEVDALRIEGRRICEFTRLAVGEDVGGSQVPAALFHAAFLIADQLQGCDTLLLEVNPRHQRFYQRVFNARQLGGLRHHHGVDAPAVLLALAAGPLARHVERAWAATATQTTATPSVRPVSAPRPARAGGAMLGRHHAWYAMAMPRIDAHEMLAQLHAAPLPRLPVARVALEQAAAGAG